MASNLFGERLRMLRKQSRMTQQQVADRLRLHRTTYTKYETGVVAPDREAMLQLAELFGVTVDFLVGREAYTASALADGTGEEIRLSLQEQNLLQMFRQLSYTEQQELIKEMQTAFRQKHNKRFL